MDYFVECKSCHEKVIIERDAPENDSVTVTGDFTAFPSCPHCGADHQYAPSDIQTQAGGSLDGALQVLRHDTTPVNTKADFSAIFAFFSLWTGFWLNKLPPPPRPKTTSSVLAVL
jgi:hypothetical protein